MARLQYQPQASFRTYLYQIARNRLIDVMRQQSPLLAGDLGQAQGQDAADDPADGGSFAQLAAHAGESGSVSPEAAWAHKRQIASLHAAIRALPSEQREALVLHWQQQEPATSAIMSEAAPSVAVKQKNAAAPIAVAQAEPSAPLNAAATAPAPPPPHGCKRLTPCKKRARPPMPWRSGTGFASRIPATRCRSAWRRA